MKKTIYILLAFIALTQIGCQNDPLEDIQKGNWNNERSILGIKFENQVGKAVITRVDDATGEINLAINIDAVPNLTSIKIKELVLSYKATSNVLEGQTLNFENATKSNTLTVTSPTGKERVYTIKVSSFTETIIGTFNITNLVVYGGTGPEYGGGEVIVMSNKPWLWTTDGPEKEKDNFLVFTMTGITDDGNTYGEVINNAGNDGKYANFLYVPDPQTDVTNFYRKIPAGKSEWKRDYAAGTITFTSASGVVTVGTFENAGTESLGNGNTKIISNNAFAFNLNGTDDWGKIFTDYDKIVKHPRRYWIDVTRQN